MRLDPLDGFLLEDYYPVTNLQHRGILFVYQLIATGGSGAEYCGRTYHTGGAQLPVKGFWKRTAPICFDDVSSISIY